MVFMVIFSCLKYTSKKPFSKVCHPVYILITDVFPFGPYKGMELFQQTKWQKSTIFNISVFCQYVWTYQNYTIYKIYMTRFQLLYPLGSNPKNKPIPMYAEGQLTDLAFTQKKYFNFLPSFKFLLGDVVPAIKSESHLIK